MGLFIIFILVSIFFSGKNVLRIDGSNGPEEISFLGESELPNNAKQHNAEEADGKMET